MGKTLQEKDQKQPSTIGRRDFVKIIGAGAAGLLASNLVFAESAPPTRKPNVVLIVADDLGYCDVSLYGCRNIPTPNIDSIFTDGASFPDGYVTAPICSPSRAGLLTGRYQQRFGFEFNTGPLWRDLQQGLGLPLNETTLADAMKKAGYATGMVGKWHQGMQEQFHPMARGFDEFFGFTFGGNLYGIAGTPDLITGKEERSGPRRSSYHPILRGRTAVEENEYLTDAFTREAVAFIARHRQEPFFLYVPYSAPHKPHQVTRKYYDRFKHIEDERKRIYAGMVSALDDGIGEILKTLKEQGLEKDTLVIFLSDNGCALYTRACSNDPLKEGKIHLFEGGVRIPFAMKWPGTIPANQTFGQAISSLDIFPTVVAATGATMPTDQARDGVNLLPYLTGQKKSSPHEHLFWRMDANSAVRSAEWKLFKGNDRYWLFDLHEDIGEAKDRSADRPDVLKTMKDALLSWNSELKSPLWPPHVKLPYVFDGEKLNLSV